MAELLSILVTILLLFVLTWVAIFGGVGGVLAATRGGSALGGLAWGVFFGPLGWLVILWRTRGRRTAPSAPVPQPAAWPEPAATVPIRDVQRF